LLGDGRDYGSIVAMREIEDHARRGYLFEAAIREILPWSFRPPLAATAPAEQLDAFFEWNSWHFLVEAKAKRRPISRPSHDWEDFELKLTRRRSTCIGLFCSLYPVAPAVVSAAEEMNRNGATALILAGEFWDELNQANVPIEHVLRHMVAAARAKGAAAPPPLAKLDAVYDIAAVDEELRALARTRSATFLRRHKLDRHGDLYVPRSVDATIQGFADALRPVGLLSLGRERTHLDKTYTSARSLPNQLLVLRDASGAGKTTASVELALSKGRFVGLTRAAVEPELDDLADVLRQLGDDYGLAKLRAANRSMVVAIDSLDEAGHLPHKPAEISSLIKTVLDDLNPVARQHGMLAFPLGLVFTVREDYWERWNAMFDGRAVTTLRRRFSTFTAEEFTRALRAYSSAYGYRIAGGLPREARQVLSTPFNLLVFSEANERQGTVPADDVLSKGVLTLYFDRKCENLLKRPFPHLTEPAIMLIAAGIAMEVVERRVNELDWATAADIVVRVDPLQRANGEEIVRGLVSEQLLADASDDGQRLRFRHSRFVEYLLAYHIAYWLSHGKRYDFLRSTTETIFATSIVSMFRVHELIRHICARRFPGQLKLIDDFYARSSAYMTHNLSRLRVEVAHGAATPDEDIALIVEASANADPDVAWGSFFVLAAGPNDQSPKLVVEAFERAWAANEERDSRWKLLSKLDALGLLLEPAVFNSVARSRRSKDWEVYVGALLERDEHGAFAEMWEEAGLDVDELPGGAEWRQARGLIEIALTDGVYVRGERLDLPGGRPATNSAVRRQPRPPAEPAPEQPPDEPEQPPTSPRPLPAPRASGPHRPPTPAPLHDAGIERPGRLRRAWRSRRGRSGR
jgi:hypothetical protein